jgi:hypothetical protein
LHLLLKIVAGIAGGLLLYAAFFLYEDEENRLQNRIERIWAFINTLHNSAMSKEAAFLQQTSRVSSLGLDILLGKNLFSVQLVAVVMSFSFVSILWFIAVSHTYPAFNPIIEVLGIVFFALGSLPAFIGAKRLSSKFKNPDAWKIRHSVSLIVLVVISAVLCERYWLGYDEWTPFLILGVLGGTVADLFFVVVFRWLLRKMVGFSSFWTLGLCLLAMSTVGVLLVAPSIGLQGWLGDLASGEGSDTQFYSLLAAISISATNWIDAVCALLAVAVMIVLLLHRIIWPVIKRPIYAANRKQLIKNSKLLGTLGTALMLYAFPANPVVRVIVHLAAILKS